MSEYQFKTVVFRSKLFTYQNKLSEIFFIYQFKFLQNSSLQNLWWIWYFDVRTKMIFFICNGWMEGRKVIISIEASVSVLGKTSNLFGKWGKMINLQPPFLVASMNHFLWKDDSPNISIWKLTLKLKWIVKTPIRWFI